jgi:hypothetical protein
VSKVIGRFYVQSFDKRAGGDAVVTLSAVTSKENARWSQYTPNGEVKMSLTRKASGARSAFEEMIGKECLVTFDFDVPKGEAPEYRREGEPDQLGYVSDEESA